MPAGPGSELATSPRTPNPSSAAACATPRIAAGPKLRIAYDSAAADELAADLELRLHQQHEITAGFQTGHEGGKHQPQGDERQVGHDQLDPAADVCR